MDNASWLPVSSRRSALVITLAAIAILVVITAWTGWTGYHSRLKESEDYRSYLATISANSILSRLRSLENSVEAVSAGYRRRDTATSGFDTELRSMLPLLMDTYWVCITDQNGVVRFTSTPSLAGKTITGLPRAPQDLPPGGDTLHMSPPLDTPDARYAILVSRAVRDSSGSLAGMAVLAIKPMLFYQDLASSLPDNNGAIILFGRDYRIRLRLPESGVSEGKSLAGHPMIETFLASGRTEAHYRVENTLDGVERFVTYRALPGSSGLLLAVSEEADLVVGAWSTRFLGLALLSATGAGLILLLCWLAFRASSGALSAERKMREQMAMLTSLIENLPVEACAHDLDGVVIFKSVRCRCEDSRLTPFPVDAAPDPGAYLRAWMEKNSLALSGVSSKTVEEHSGEDGRKHFIENYRGPIYQDDRIIGSLGVNIDITDLKRAEEDLRTALAEKEVMLQEIHHRVKNNLQIILSLITLQCQADCEEEPNPALARTCDRIRGMALIHELLYQSGDLSCLDMRQYVPSLLNQIRATFENSTAVTCLDLDIGKVRLPLDKAVPFGLILNELATNAFKHAFNGGRDGILQVHLHKAGNGSACLTVRDNGPGLPQGFDLDADATLGMQLIRALSAQLGGGARAFTEHGACFEITFQTGQTVTTQAGTVR